MSKKSYKRSEKAAQAVGEPTVAYRKMESANAVDWNPNTPVHATQEEWWEHIHEIEKGPFMSADEYKQKFNAWKKEFLASLMK